MQTVTLFESIIYQYSFLFYQIIIKFIQSKRSYMIFKDYYLTLMQILTNCDFFCRRIWWEFQQLADICS